MLRKVVLPEPDGPVTATNSPSPTETDRSRSAWVSTSRSHTPWRRPSCEAFEKLLVALLGDAHAPGVAEGGGAGDDDPIADLGARQELDGVEADRAGPDRPALGDAAVDDVRGVAAAGLEERAALDL